MRILIFGATGRTGRELPTHLSEEPNALEEVVRLARVWFETHLAPVQASDHTSA
jgi:dihydrodipicolinate reductase